LLQRSHNSHQQSFEDRFAFIITSITISNTNTTMKLSAIACLATAFSTAAALTTADTNLFEDTTAAKAPVGIKVKCVGIDFTKLSYSQNTVAGNALQDAYNTVHASAENDDSELSSLSYRGSASGALLGDAGTENLDWSFRHSTSGA
jgi:hypothetical protein